MLNYICNIYNKNLEENDIKHVKSYIKDTKNNHIKIRFVGDINGEKKYYFKNNLFYKNKI